MKITIISDALYIGDDIVIDARKKILESYPRGWSDPKAFQEIGNAWKVLKGAYLNNENIEEALKEFAVINFGVKREEIEAVEIEGGIPEHWKEMKEGKIKFR